jgi:flagellum-specific ATP synthase
MFNLADQLDSILPAALEGSVAQIVGMTAAVAGFPAPLGALAQIERDTGRPARAEVIGFRNDLTLLYPHESLHGVRRGNCVRLLRTARLLPVGDELLGRVVDADARAIDGRAQPAATGRTALHRLPPPALTRPPIDDSLGTGIRAIDGLLTCGQGQRIGIFAGSGLGKSVLLGMMARSSSADVNVIALVGERGREVNQFIERDLDEDGLKRSVVVVSTSDEPALRRVQAAQAATAIAESFRDEGREVLLVMDSLTRVAMAQREIGLAAGEPPTSRGYPPSVFSMLPQLVERAGRAERGSITGIYAVLVEGDDPQEPISDAVRGLLDGHIWLSRKLAAQAHWPAIDVLESISRLMPDVASSDHQTAAQIIREVLAAYRDHEDLISIGAYRRGANRRVDAAIEMLEEIHKYLRQRIDELSSLDAARNGLLELARRVQQKLDAPQQPTI